MSKEIRKIHLADTVTKVIGRFTGADIAALVVAAKVKGAQIALKVVDGVAEVATREQYDALKAYARENRVVRKDEAEKLMFGSDEPNPTTGRAQKGLAQALENIKKHSSPAILDSVEFKDAEVAFSALTRPRIATAAAKDREVNFASAIALAKSTLSALQALVVPELVAKVDRTLATITGTDWAEYKTVQADKVAEALKAETPGKQSAALNGVLAGLRKDGFHDPEARKGQAVEQSQDAPLNTPFADLAKHTWDSQPTLPRGKSRKEYSKGKGGRRRRDEQDEDRSL